MFHRNNHSKTEKKSPWQWLGIVAFVVNVIGAIFLLLHPNRIKGYLRGQKRELKELSAGEEDIGHFMRDSGSLLKDFFIPHQGNDHKPKGLRPKSLLTYATIALVIKAAVTGFLFFTYPTPANLSAIIAERMIELVNKARVEAGVTPLVANQTLTQSAQTKGQDMIDRDYFAHDTPEGKRPWQWIDKSLYDYIYAGENLAMDFVSAEVVQSALMQSPAHRKNIVNPKYHDIGVAVIHGKLNDRNTILLVEFFGTQRKDKQLVTVTGSQTSPATSQPTAPPPSPTPVVTPPAPEPTPTPPPVVTPPTPTVLPVENPTVPPVVAGDATAEATQPVVEAPVSEPLNQTIIAVEQAQQSSRTVVDRVIEYSNVFFIAFFIFILIALMLNVLIKIRVQHASVILQTVAVAALLLALTVVKFHFAEQIPTELLIL